MGKQQWVMFGEEERRSTLNFQSRIVWTTLFYYAPPRHCLHLTSKNSVELCSSYVGFFRMVQNVNTREHKKADC
jgi:hypothetical protein